MARKKSNPSPATTPRPPKRASAPATKRPPRASDYRNPSSKLTPESNLLAKSNTKSTSNTKAKSTSLVSDVIFSPAVTRGFKKKQNSVANSVLEQEETNSDYLRRQSNNTGTCDHLQNMNVYTNLYSTIHCIYQLIYNVIIVFELGNVNVDPKDANEKASAPALTRDIVRTKQPRSNKRKDTVTEDTVPTKQQRSKPQDTVTEDTVPTKQHRSNKPKGIFYLNTLYYRIYNVIYNI